MLFDCYEKGTFLWDMRDDLYELQVKNQIKLIDLIIEEQQYDVAKSHVDKLSKNFKK